MNDLELFGEEKQQWYTLEDLALLSGISVETLKKGDSPIRKFGLDFKVESKTVNIGGHKNIKKYSENVLKMLKEYQLKNGAPNALKNKKTAIEGTVSAIKTETVKSTIENLLDNPQTLNMLLTESLARTKALGIENKQLKDVIERQRPAVEYHARLVDRNHLTNIRDTAKELQVSERKFIIALIENKWIYRDKGNRIRACADKVKDGLLEEKDWEQNGKTGVQTFFTVKGKHKVLKWR